MAATYMFHMRSLTEKFAIKISVHFSANTIIIFNTKFVKTSEICRLKETALVRFTIEKAYTRYEPLKFYA